jgi:hypothetical protein
MAAGQLSLTRRALLAGACASPVVGSAGMGAPSLPDRTARESAEARWGRALARFRAADAAIGAARHSDDEALYDRLGDRHDVAMKRMLRTPAPDLGALAVKLETLFGEQAWEMRGGALLLAAILRDARRLALG